MEVTPQRVRISLVLDSVFFPLTAKEAFNSFSKREFVLGQPTSTLPTGPRVYVNGNVARKGSGFVNIEQPRNLVGVQGDSIEECLKVFEEILDILKNDFDFSFEDDLNYVELIAQYLVPSESSPFKTIQNSAILKPSQELEEILGLETSVYSYSISPKGLLPSSKKWFEITISPKLTMPEKAYWLEVVFRDFDIEPVTSFGANLNQTIGKILETISK
jgi:hypothetical protein